MSGSVKITIRTLTNNKYERDVTPETTVREVREDCCRHFHRDLNFFFLSKTNTKAILPDDDLILNHGNTFKFFSDRKAGNNNNNQSPQNTHEEEKKSEENPQKNISNPQLPEIPFGPDLSNPMPNYFDYPQPQLPPINAPTPIFSEPRTQPETQENNDAQDTRNIINEFLADKQITEEQQNTFKKYHEMRPSILLNDLFFLYQVANFDDNLLASILETVTSIEKSELHLFSEKAVLQPSNPTPGPAPSPLPPPSPLPSPQPNPSPMPPPNPSPLPPPNPSPLPPPNPSPLPPPNPSPMPPPNPSPMPPPNPSPMPPPNPSPMPPPNPSPMPPPNPSPLPPPNPSPLPPPNPSPMPPPNPSPMPPPNPSPMPPPNPSPLPPPNPSPLPPPNPSPLPPPNPSPMPPPMHKGENENILAPSVPKTTNHDSEKTVSQAGDTQNADERPPDEDDEEDNKKVSEFMSKKQLTPEQQEIFRTFHKQRKAIILDELFFLFEATGFDENQFKQLLDTL